MCVKFGYLYIKGTRYEAGHSSGQSEVKELKFKTIYFSVFTKRIKQVFMKAILVYSDEQGLAF